MFGNSGQILKLYGKLDPETTKLFGRFVARCLSMKNANTYLKRILTNALEESISPEQLTSEHMELPEDG